LLDQYTNSSRDLKLSIAEGSFNAVMVGAGLSFIVAFAVMLGANSIEVGLLSALPALLGAWAQLFSIKMLDLYKSRKNLIIMAVFLQAISWLPIMLIPFFMKENSVVWIIIFYTAGTVFGSIGAPAWQSWMKSLTPANIIGKYFGIRNSIVGAVALTTMLIAGFALGFFTEQALIVYVGIFLASMLGRLLSTYLFTKITDPGCGEDGNCLIDEKITFREFTKNLLKTNFGYFVLFGSLMTFGISLTGPFLSFYWLDYLGLKNNYFLFTIILASSSISALISMPYWGKLIDKYGIKKVLKATSYLAITFPILIILVRAPEWIILVELLNGVIFSGFNLALASFIYEFSGESRIMRYASYQAVFFGTAAFLGTILSGYIQNFEFSFWIINTSFFLICAISILVRLISYSALIDKIKEEKPVEYIGSKKIVFNILTFAPVRETVINNMLLLFVFGTGQIASTVKKIEEIGEDGFEEIKKVGEIGNKGMHRMKNAANGTVRRIEEIGEDGLEEIKKVEEIGQKGMHNVKNAATTIRKESINGIKKIKNFGSEKLLRRKKRF